MDESEDECRWREEEGQGVEKKGVNGGRTKRMMCVWVCVCMWNEEGGEGRRVNQLWTKMQVQTFVHVFMCKY